MQIRPLRLLHFYNMASAQEWTNRTPIGHMHSTRYYGCGCCMGRDSSIWMIHERERAITHILEIAITSLIMHSTRYYGCGCCVRRDSSIWMIHERERYHVSPYHPRSIALWDSAWNVWWDMVSWLVPMNDSRTSSWIIHMNESHTMSHHTFHTVSHYDWDSNVYIHDISHVYTHSSQNSNMASAHIYIHIIVWYCVIYIQNRI